MPKGHADRLVATDPPFRLGAASVVGASHVARAEECQDFWRATTLANGALLLVVADGAGSARHGALGAAIVTDAITRCFVTLTAESKLFARDKWEIASRVAFERARDAIATEAAAANRAVGDYAATGIVVIAKGGFVAAAQIGDGAVVIGDGIGYQMLTKPQNGEYANLTTFVTSGDALAQIQYGVRARGRRVSELAVMTDGVQPIALSLRDMEPHAGFLRPLLQFVDKAPPERVTAELTAFLSSDRVRARTDDDLTLVLAVRDRPPEGKSS